MCPAFTRHACTLLAALALCLPVAALALDYEDAASAWRRGDEAAALEGFRELAEGGLVAAQENLAHMYMNGEGTARDFEEGLRWLTRAAEGGSATARMALGALYWHGEGVQADPVVAYAWFSLATYSGDDLAMAYLYKVAETLSPTDIDRARVLARQMFERFGLAEQELVDAES